MSTLVLKLAGPLQSWGVRSRYTTRDTSDVPTKSGLVGLLAAAQGRRRSDPIEDLLALRLAVRTEKPGGLLRDYHTMSRSTGDRRIPTADGKKLKEGESKITERFYLEDACFLAFIEGPRPILEGLQAALLSPYFPLALGRRSCPPAGRILVDLVDEDADSALRSWPWAASIAEQRRLREPTVSLPFVVDDPAGALRVHDVPISWAPGDRRFGWRTVSQGFVDIANPEAQHDRHDPFELLG